MSKATIAKEYAKSGSSAMNKRAKKAKKWFSKKKNQRKATVVVGLAIILFLAASIVLVRGAAVREQNRNLEEQSKIEYQATEKLLEAEKEIERKDTQLKKKEAEKDALKKSNEQLKIDLQAKKAEEARIAAIKAEEQKQVASSPAPVAPAAPKVVAASGSGSCDLAYGYDWPQSVAYQICQYESGGNPNAANWGDDHSSWAGCFGSFGLMQINCSNGQVYDGPRNMSIAYSMYKAAGNSFSPWTTCAKVAGCS